MTPFQTLLWLRLIELAVMFAATWWITHSPPSRFRRIRLSFAWVLICLNLAAIVVAVGWAKVTLW